MAAKIGLRCALPNGPRLSSSRTAVKVRSFEHDFRVDRQLGSRVGVGLRQTDLLGERLTKGVDLVGLNP